MSLHTATDMSTVKARVTAASQSSKIALFKAKFEGKTAIEAVFDNTVATRARMNKKYSGYLGSFYGKAGADKAELVAMVNF